MMPLLRALVLAYAALLPYQIQVGERLNFAPADILLLLVLLLTPGTLYFRRPAWSGWHLAIALTVCLGALIAALRFGVIQRYELVNKCAGLFLPMLSYAAITSCILAWSDLRRLMRAFIYGVVVENIVAVGVFLASYFFGIANPFARYGGLRLAGTLLDPNAYGGLLVAALVMCEGGSYGDNPLISGVPLWIARSTLSLGILFTFSRSAWLALGSALLVLLMIRTRMAVRRVLAGAVAVPCVFVLMGPRFLPIFETMASRPRQVEGRFEMIHSALGMFAAHPLLGGGLGNFRRGEGEIAHNTAMWFLADFGIVGLVAVLGFLGWFFVKAWSAYRAAPSSEQPVVLGLLLAHTAMLGLAMGIEAFYQRPWWMVFALIASSYCLTLRRTGNRYV
jgi:putative inorganic carbon (hco3(-)) transporter